MTPINPPDATTDLLVDKQGWDSYWNQKNEGGLLYALIASFYRKVIIRPNFNYFMRKTFKPSAKLLHAGCGTGEVDVDVRRHFKITGLDISPAALALYEKNNSAYCQSLRGSILALPLPDRSVDGIYNLGVLEHFSREDIRTILSEFRRVLVDGGKMVILWPPEYGLSVLFFKGLKRVIKLFFNKDMKFHPDEISRLQSKKQAHDIFREAGFTVLQYYFGIRDVWTYSVVIVEKTSS